MTDDATLKQFDDLLKDSADVAAIVVCERLRPVQGPRGVFFPPTFAGIGQGKKSDYHIDSVGPRADDPQGASRDGVIANRCTIDSVPSQANHLETRLLRHSGTLIPKVIVSGSRANGRPLDLLEIGHRVGDAVLRFTANGFERFREAMQAFVSGDAAPLASLAPTSLVFGHWDSRPGGTKSKARRLVRSEIVAYNVARVTKRSQYWSSIDPEVSEELGQILAEAREATSRDAESKNPASQLGMTDVPAPPSAGGVIAFGRIERTSIIALSGLRALAAFGEQLTPGQSGHRRSELAADPERTLALRRYLFALSLASVAGAGVWDLREGCILVRNGPAPTGDLPKELTPMSSVQVRYTGEEVPFKMPEDVDAYLTEAAAAFFNNGVPNIDPLMFDPAAARTAIDVQRGGASAEPKTKDALVAALLVRPEYAGKDAELRKKKKPELQELWRAAPDGEAESPTEPDSPAPPARS